MTYFASDFQDVDDTPAAQRFVQCLKLNYWCDSFPAGWVERRLLQYFRQAGLTQIQVMPETLVITQFDLADQVFDLIQTARATVAAGIASQTAVEDWLRELQQLDQAQQFFSSFTGFIVSGRKEGAD